jgi:cytochrome c peroxidase
VNDAGRLDQNGARGGPRLLAQQTFVPGANDPTQSGFDPNVFKLYRAWLGLGGKRGAIARGEQIFNTKPLAGVGPFFDQALTAVPTCSTCHSVPNIGNHPVFRVFDIGTANPSMPNASELPLITVMNRHTGETRSVTDLGHALETGRWADVGAFAVPRLRGLSSRAPYFHDGSAATLEDVVSFYEARFHVSFTGSERADLVAFLSAL